MMAYRRLNGYRPLPCPKEISADGHDTLSEVQRYTEAADRRRAVTGAIPSKGGVQYRK
jgi:hypothetical protein